MTTIASSTTAVTLTPADRNVTLNGTIDADGSIGSYNVAYGHIGRAETFYAAVFGPAGTAFTLDNTGTITDPGSAAYASGIILGSPGTITNAGLIAGENGIAEFGTAAGAVIANTGTIIASSAGIYLQSSANVKNSGFIASDDFGIILSGGAVTNKAGGFIYGQNEGIFGYAPSGTIAISNRGDIYGGIELIAEATITNARGATIAGHYAAGIESGAPEAVSVVNAGQIVAQAAGVELHGANSYLLNNKTGGIEGGVYLSGNNAYVNNYGSISGYNGIQASGLNASIYNSGNVTAASGNGITSRASVYNYKGGAVSASKTAIYTAGYVYNTGIITAGNTGIYDAAAPTGQNYIYNAGVINAGTTGIYRGTGGDSDALAITNTGSITGSAEAGIHIRSNASILNTGKITGGYYGVYGYNTSVKNTGSIISTSTSYGTGIRIDGAFASITNSKSGIIAGNPSNGAGININADYATVINNGIVSGNAGIVMEAGYGLLVNAGEISGSYGGVGVFGGTLRNSGTITETAYNGNAAGVEIADGAITNAAAGVIEAASYGVILEAGDVLDNAGTISAGSSGVIVDGGGQYVKNSGLIAAGKFGVAIYGQSALLNLGTIISNDRGVDATEHSTFTNDGAVEGRVYLASGATLVNAGFISETAEVDGQGTIIDTGTINSIAFLGSGGVLKLGTNADIEGLVELAGNSLELAAGNGAAGSGAAGKGAGTINLNQYDEIGTLHLDAGATWTASGNAVIGGGVNNGLLDLTTLSASHVTFAGALTGSGTVDLTTGDALTLDGATGAHQTIAFTGTGDTLSLGDPGSFSGTIANFKTNETIDLTGVTLANITASSFAGGTLTLAGSSATYTYAFSGSFTGETFSLFADGRGTGITLSTTTPKMAFLTPASSGATTAPTTLPPTPTAYAPTPTTQAAIPTLTTPGLISHNLITTTATTPIVTLHA